MGKMSLEPLTFMCQVIHCFENFVNLMIIVNTYILSNDKNKKNKINQKKKRIWEKIKSNICVHLLNGAHASLVSTRRQNEFYCFEQEFK